MKTKIPSWLIVFLFVAASIFDCGSVQAQDSTHWQRDMVLGPDGASGNNRPATEPAWEQNEDAAGQINDQGNEYFEKGDYEEALKYYQEAYDKSQLERYAKTYRNNIADAKNMIAYEAVHQQAENAWNNQDYSDALRLYEEQQKLVNGPNVRKCIADAKALLAWSKATTAADYRRAIKMQPKLFTPENIRYVEGLEANEKQQRQDKITAGNIQQSIQNLAQKLIASPAIAGGLDFDDGKGNVAIPGLEFGDPMVVDGRKQPSGLPKSVDAAIPHTPAGDRMRKGYEAIKDGDWQVALACFQDALNKEPGDPDLQRLVDLSQFTLVYRAQPKSTPLPNQGSTAKPDGGDEPVDSMAEQNATVMAAQARAKIAFDQYVAKYGDESHVLERAAAVGKAMRGEGYTKKELQEQLHKALLDYQQRHANSHDPNPVNGGQQPTADDIFLGGKG